MDSNQMNPDKDHTFEIPKKTVEEINGINLVSAGLVFELSDDGIIKNGAAGRDGVVDPVPFEAKAGDRVESVEEIAPALPEPAPVYRWKHLRYNI